jgi:putative oxidoreductase
MIARILTGRPLNLLLRLGRGGRFLYAALEKVLHPAAFAIAVRGYKIVPFAYSNLFSLALSWSELVAAIALILGVFTRKAAGAVFILLIVFIAGISATLIRGMVIDCGCFGEGGSSTSWLLIVRNVFLLAGAYLVVRYNDGWLSLHPRTTSASTS